MNPSADRTLADLTRRVKQGARLKRQLRLAGITHDQVAAAAGVTRTAVVNVLAGRGSSANVIATVKRLLAERAPAQAS